MKSNFFQNIINMKYFPFLLSIFFAVSDFGVKLTAFKRELKIYFSFFFLPPQYLDEILLHRQRWPSFTSACLPYFVVSFCFVNLFCYFLLVIHSFLQVDFPAGDFTLCTLAGFSLLREESFVKREKREKARAPKSTLMQFCQRERDIFSPFLSKSCIFASSGKKPKFNIS